MKIVICTKQDLAGNLALNRLMRGLGHHHTIHVVLSDYILPQERASGYASYLVRHERDMVLDTIFPYIDNNCNHDEPPSCRTFKGIEDHYDVAMELWGNIAEPASVDRMQQLAPDLIISCRYDYIFRQDIIDLPRLGIYGLHPGALPMLQGLCSPFRAMTHHHSLSGCTLFTVDIGLDTGPTIDIGWHTIAYDRSLLWNFVHTYFAGIDTLLRYLPSIERNETIYSSQQPPSLQTYYSYPSEQDFQQFINDGGHLVTYKDYIELLSWYLPSASAEPHLRALGNLITPGKY